MALDKETPSVAALASTRPVPQLFPCTAHLSPSNAHLSPSTSCSPMDHRCPSHDDLLYLVKPSLPKSDVEALDLVQNLTLHADLVQSHTLSAILQRNAQTEYLLRHGLQGRYDPQIFKSQLPVITYEDLQPEIQRIANGDTSPILSSYPVSEFLTSSGTSAGERKLMPTIQDEFERRCLLYSFLMPIMNQFVPDLDKGKGMYFYFIKSEVKTPGGLLARPVLTSYYKSHWFTERPYDPYNVCTSPNETVLCPDSFQSMYCQMLCGLLECADVLRMGAVFASGFLRAIRFLQEQWPQLCHDIRTAELSDIITDQPARQAVCRILAAAGPNSELASKIAEICASCQENSRWDGIIPRIWPCTKYIDVIVTGAMAQYIPTLDMYSGGLPLVCTMYASSECYFGVNLHPLCKPADVSYTLIPNMAYFEFLPVLSRGSNRSDCLMKHTNEHTQKSSAACGKEHLTGDERWLVELVDVQVGCEYELVVTTYAGLYRYRVGDILRVTGFHNKAPQFEFVCRKNVALSIDADKTDEDTLHRAVEVATSKNLDQTSAVLVEYTSYVDLSTIPGHYVLFWELQYSEKTQQQQDDEDDEMKGVLGRCCLEIEERLDSVYRQGRVADKSIGPLEIRLVKPRSFEALMDYCLSRGASINQYKAPRCVKAAPIVELMNSRVTSSSFSPCCPSWR